MVYVNAQETANNPSVIASFDTKPMDFKENLVKFLLGLLNVATHKVKQKLFPPIYL
jgi:hypothetical protein